MSPLGTVHASSRPGQHPPGLSEQNCDWAGVIEVEKMRVKTKRTAKGDLLVVAEIVVSMLYLTGNKNGDKAKKSL